MPGNKAAIGQHYNAASDRYISHDGVVHALAKAAGVEAKIVHYDTKAVSLAKVSVRCILLLLPVPMLVLAACGSDACKGLWTIVSPDAGLRVLCNACSAKTSGAVQGTGL